MEREGQVMIGIIKVAIAAFVLLSFAAPASAATTVSITDPAGDVTHKGPGYLDVVGASVTKQGPTLVFGKELAAPIPQDIGHITPGNDELWWAWGIDTDPNTAPQGFPGPNGASFLGEFGLWVSWDGTSFSGNLVDRRPLLTGGAAVITPVPFSVTGNQVSMTVRTSDLGNATSFMWNSPTFYRSTNTDEANGWHTADINPFSPSP
jgi:hypothetical protein